jgi:hypothetical protein
MWHVNYRWGLVYLTFTSFNVLKSEGRIFVGLAALRPDTFHTDILDHQVPYRLLIRSVVLNLSVIK